MYCCISKVAQVACVMFYWHNGRRIVLKWRGQMGRCTSTEAAVVGDTAAALAKHY